MRRYIYLLIILWVSIGLILSSCAQTDTNSVSEKQSEGVITQPTYPVIRILDLSLVDPNMISVAIATPTIEPTPYVIPTMTPLPTQNTSSLIETPKPTSPACTNHAEFIRHITIPDNTALKTNQQFTKIWEIKNVGTCIWTTSYSLIFIDGESMYSPPSIPLPKIVKPGETINLSLNLMAPKEPNTYIANWVLKDTQGNLFGTGDQANLPLGVKIVINRTIRFKPI